MQDSTQLIRHHQAVLAGVLAHHNLPRPVASRISSAADELLDPTELPELLRADDPELRDPQTAVSSTIQALRMVLPRLDANVGLACGRAIAHLISAQDLWGKP